MSDRWIAVSSGYPLDHEDVLVAFAGGDCRYDIANWDSEEGWWSLSNKHFDQPDIDPTHWMPLPELPE